LYSINIFTGEKTPLYLETNINVNTNDLIIQKWTGNEWENMECTFINVVDNVYKCNLLFNETLTALIRVVYKDIEIAKALVKVKENILKKIYEMEFGTWEIKDNKMYFYDTKGNLLASFALYDSFGNPSSESVFLRKKIDN